MLLNKIMTDTADQHLQDQAWMQEVLALAKQAPSTEVPIAGILVEKNEKLVAGVNLRETHQDPMGHIEIQLIQEACKKRGSWRLPNTTLYVLIEPCLMCTGVIYAARIARVVFGAHNAKGGALTFIEEHRKKLGLNHSVDWSLIDVQKEAADLMKRFFATKREKNK